MSAYVSPPLRPGSDDYSPISFKRYMKTPKRPSSIPQLVLPEYSFVSGVDYVSVLPVNRSWFVVGRTYSSVSAWRVRWEMIAAKHSHGENVDSLRKFRFSISRMPGPADSRERSEMLFASKLKGRQPNRN
jgi:hypothetical protein